MNDELAKIIQIYKNFYKLDISMFDDKFLKQVMDNRLSIHEINKSEDFLNILMNNPEEADSFYKLFNNNYTEFFRNILTFAHLEQWIIPNLIEKKYGKSELRIWSAGCSTGEEAYSIAMILENINLKRKEKVRYRIIATDINESALKEANIGIYNESDISKIRVNDLKEYFFKSGKKYRINEELKKNIIFTRYDLLDNMTSCPQESIFGSFDLVMCCNLLFYYNMDHQKQILEKLVNAMDENGFLVTGETEKRLVSLNKSIYLPVPPSPIFKRRRGAE